MRRLPPCPAVRPLDCFCSGSTHLCALCLSNQNPSECAPSTRASCYSDTARLQMSDMNTSRVCRSTRALACKCGPISTCTTTMQAWCPCRETPSEVAISLTQSSVPGQLLPGEPLRHGLSILQQCMVAWPPMLCPSRMEDVHQDCSSTCPCSMFHIQTAQSLRWAISAALFGARQQRLRLSLARSELLIPIDRQQAETTEH